MFTVAAAKSLQSCPTLQPHRRQPTRLPRPWDPPGKNSGVGCHFLLQCMKVKSESEVTQLCPTLKDAMDCSPPGSSVHGFSRQEYWSGVPLPSPYLQWFSIEDHSVFLFPHPHSHQGTFGNVWRYLKNFFLFFLVSYCLLFFFGCAVHYVGS